mmetsp:Transcript_73442/g.117055  ORF Transcript_73442/g.117055 Transcript_73442/m.117055 type:complete len:349 (+) Transcript_73442:27-1073(+)
MSEALDLGEWGYFLITVSIIFVIISFIFCVVATIQGIQEYRAKAAGDTDANILRSQKWTLILTISCMWSFTAINICDAVGLPHWFMNKDVQYDDWEEWEFNWEHSSRSYLMWNVFWAVAKFNLYLVYLYRIRVVSKQSKYSSSAPWESYVTLLVLMVAQFVCLVMWLWYYNISWYCCQIWADNQWELLAALAWAILSLDVLISALLIFLYIACMRKLIASLPANALRMDTINVAGVTGGDKKDAVDPGDPSQGWQRQEAELLQTATRLFVLGMVSFASSILYQILFGVSILEEFTGSHAHTALYYFTFTWNVDSTLNVLCLYLSLPVGKNLYRKLCRCDACCLKLVQK